MSRSSTPGFPAGRHSAPHGNRARSFDYPQEELRDDEPYDPALLTGPGQGGVGVFQAPRATPGGDTSPVEPVSAAPMLVGDGTDIDSPFLDLFGGGPRPGTPPSPGAPSPGGPARRGPGRQHQPAPHRPAAAPTPPAAIEAQAPPAAIEAAPPTERPARTRVPHQQGDRPAPGPTGARPTEPPQRAPRRVPAELFPRETGEPLTAREAAERARREATERAREAADRSRREAAETARREAAEQARREGVEAARRETIAQTQREATETARREAADAAQREATEHARRAAAEAARLEAAELSRRESAEQARRDAALTARPRPTPVESTTAAWPEHVEPAWPEATEAAWPEPAGPVRVEAVTTPVGALTTEPARRALAEPDRSEPAEPGSRELAAPRQRAASRRTEATKPVRVRPPKIKFGDRDPSIDLAITEIAGHLTFTPNTVTAWYWLPEVRWAFRPDAEREALLSAISEQYAGLAGFRLHLRRTTRPFPADEWARTIDAHTASPLPDVPGTHGWADHLVAAQQHLMSVNHAEGQTYLGVTFARRSLGDSLTERLLRAFGKGTADGERRKLGRTVEQFDEVLGSFGMRGRRVTAQELEWLLYRSVALCMAPPGTLSPVTNGRWERGDLLALTEQVERYRTPYGTTVKLVNRMTGEERHVAVLAVGRMEPLEIPERHEPWLHFHERLPWPMEISTRVDILGSGDSFRNLEHRLRMIRSQQLDYAEHGIDAPPELERLAKRALVIGDEMTTGLPVDSARAHGWHRIAVGGRTREECMERARRLIQLYSRELRISLQHPKNQDWLAREFIPGEPIANTGYVRRMPVPLLAAALPQAASTVGDRRGDLIGRTAGTCRRPVFLDLHFPMEVRERSGLAVFVAEPGGGKSTLLGALGYLAARRGVQVTLLDPSGPLARLCAMPELKPYARVLNLTGSEPGTLAPYSLIPTPLRSEFSTGAAGDREFEIAISNARAERRMLVQDICMMLVPPQVAREASTATLFRHAVRQVPAEETSTLDDVVTCLQGLDDDAGRELAHLLLDTAEMPLAMLFFGRPPEGLLGADAALTVITMAGLRLPDLKIEREYWSAEEALALPMLHTAHRLAVRRCYGGSMSSRKLVGLDEAHFMEGWRSGRSFLVRLARDSRKWNLAALVASQNPKDILGLDVQNLVSTVFVGRIAEDTEIASEALRLLRVPVDDGYEATLASLSAVDTTSATRLGFREFVMRDVDGRVQKVRVDVSYVEGLLNHLDTTPAAVAQAAGILPTVLADLEA
ncbi:AAA-like domain-containing protein [Micromonospora matsumotoense]|uniref:AAA-like domain-containing protein n=1 Tax=Micromonospora matsumotoense TaxID=121616 RepID=A0A1C4ZEM0_9ACTN|nr:ATP-binding protein [Micromonospora matsumotoense]SCF31413.1 AAA-like domain-containing protein [Micromonospora matsumotoense]